MTWARAAVRRRPIEPDRDRQTGAAAETGRWPALAGLGPALIGLALCGCGGAPEVTQQDPKIECRSPNKPNGPTRSVLAWKFDIAANAIRAALAEQPAGIPFDQIVAAAAKQIDKEVLETLGKPDWLVETVRLELEVRGEVERIKAPGQLPILRLKTTAEPAQ